LRRGEAIDYEAVLQPICDAGYAGWLVVEAEQDPAKAHPLTYARLGFRNLKQAAEDAGFDVAPPPKTPVDSPASAA